MKDTALFALSSPEGSQNFFSKWINLEINGEPFFYVCDCQLICEECRKLKPDKRILCDHVKQTAHWLSKKKSERIKVLYGSDSATIAKELLGVIADDYLPCFPAEFIQETFNTPPILTKSSPKYVFITVDPSGGGMSQLGICSGYYTDHMEFVVGPIIYSNRHVCSKPLTISIILCLSYG